MLTNSGIHLHSGLGCPGSDALRASTLSASGALRASQPERGPPSSVHNESGFALLRSARESNISMPRIEVKIPENTGRFTPPLIENDNTVEPRSPSSSRSISIFRSSSMYSLYNGQPKFTMFNLAPSSDCSSCGNKK